jgi:hypothetical protein
MSMFIPNTGLPPNNNNNSVYGFYGSDVSLSLGNLNPSYGSIVIDTNNIDPSINEGVFAYNNNKPVASRLTDSLAGLSNNILKNMNNPIAAPDSYPREELFGKQDTFQYVYNNNPRKDKIGVF